MARGTRVLIVGAEGVVGAAVTARLIAHGVPVVPSSRRGTAGYLPLDLLAAPSTWLLPADVSSAVLCAAVTSTTGCRERPEEARRVNVVATVELASRLIAAGVHVVFLSSNQVFDGTVAHARADAPRCPRTTYGRMKAEAEEAILALGELATVVRLTKIVHRDMPLLAEWRKALALDQFLRPFSDLSLSPLSPQVAANAIACASTTDHRGILQVSATADLSYADVALRLAIASGYNGDLVRPVTVAESGISLEHVPLHTTLDDVTLRRWLAMTPPDPWQAVDEAILP